MMSALAVLVAQAFTGGGEATPPLGRTHALCRFIGQSDVLPVPGEFQRRRRSVENVTSTCTIELCLRQVEDSSVLDVP